MPHTTGKLVGRTPIYMDVIEDQDPDTSYLDQEEFAERRAEYERGYFHFVGVRARVELTVMTDRRDIVRHVTVTSPGLWTIESDSGEDYFREVFMEERDMLLADLRDNGFDVTLDSEVDNG